MELCHRDENLLLLMANIFLRHRERLALKHIFSSFKSRSLSWEQFCKNVEIQGVETCSISKTSVGKTKYLLF